MLIIVGSKALERCGMALRVPRDTDFWVSPDDSKPVHYGDVHVIPLEIMQKVPVTTANYSYATPDAVYTIKRSHAMYDIHWDKTISDIIHLQRKGCKLLPELHTILCKYWKTVHGDKSFLSLKKDKSEFFNDYVPYAYDHDLLHQVVAGNNLPMYTKCLKDNEEVLVDQVKFMQMSKEDQIQLFREEIQVIALERWLIPSNFRIPKVRAYRMALKKTITNLTKNWATQFILDNIETYVIMGNTKWYSNFLTHIGREITMHPIIEKVKNKAEELGYEDIAYVLHHGSYEDNTVFKASEYHGEFGQYLESLGLKHIESEGGEGQGDSAHTVIELEGQLFRTDFSCASYDGYYIDDEWDWTSVEAKEKTITVYE